MTQNLWKVLSDDQSAVCRISEIVTSDQAALGVAAPLVEWALTPVSTPDLQRIQMCVR